MGREGRPDAGELPLGLLGHMKALLRSQMHAIVIEEILFAGEFDLAELGSHALICTRNRQGVSSRLSGWRRSRQLLRLHEGRLALGRGPLLRRRVPRLHPIEICVPCELPAQRSALFSKRRAALLARKDTLFHSVICRLWPLLSARIAVNLAHPSSNQVGGMAFSKNPEDYLSRFFWKKATHLHHCVLTYRV